MIQSQININKNKNIIDTVGYSGYSYRILVQYCLNVSWQLPTSDAPPLEVIDVEEVVRESLAAGPSPSNVETWGL